MRRGIPAAQLPGGQTSDLLRAESGNGRRAQALDEAGAEFADTSATDGGQLGGGQAGALIGLEGSQLCGAECGKVLGLHRLQLAAGQGLNLPGHQCLGLRRRQGDDLRCR